MVGEGGRSRPSPPLGARVDRGAWIGAATASGSQAGMHRGGGRTAGTHIHPRGKQGGRNTGGLVRPRVCTHPRREPSSALTLPIVVAAASPRLSPQPCPLAAPDGEPFCRGGEVHPTPSARLPLGAGHGGRRSVCPFTSATVARQAAVHRRAPPAGSHSAERAASRVGAAGLPRPGDTREGLWGAVVSAAAPRGGAKTSGGQRGWFGHCCVCGPPHEWGGGGGREPLCTSIGL